MPRRVPDRALELERSNPAPLRTRKRQVSTRVDTPTAVGGQLTPGDRGVGSAQDPRFSPPGDPSHPAVSQRSSELPYTKNREPAPDLDSPQVVSAAGMQSWEGLVALAREDPDVFAEFVLRDEETGKPVEQRPMHTEMHRALSEDALLVVEAHPESGKTQQLGVARMLWQLGRDPSQRLVLLGNVQDGSMKTLGAIKRYMERSSELRAVFPRLLPGGLWRDTAITVQREVLSRDPSIYCVGYHGALLGSRVDGAVVDDLLDYENTRNEPARRECSSWFRTTFMTRTTARAWVAFLCNSWHEEDLSHELVADGWRHLLYPIYDAEGRSSWPARWPLKRIEQVRKKMGPLEFARMFLCKPRDPGAETFAPEAIRLALSRGQGYRLLAGLEEPPEGALVVHGVDVASSKKARGGASAISTLLVTPSRRQVLRLWQGRVGAREFLYQLAAAGNAFPESVMVVEDNGVQSHLVELANELDEFRIPVPVLPFTTGRNKNDRELGIDAMAAEIEAGRWRLPSGKAGPLPGPLPEAKAPELVRTLVRQMRAYVPGEHAGDLLMATWMARTWGLRRLARLARPGGPRNRVGVRVLGSSRAMIRA
jgi:hypothetical protein